MFFFLHLCMWSTCWMRKEAPKSLGIKKISVCLAFSKKKICMFGFIFEGVKINSKCVELILTYIRYSSVQYNQFYLNNLF